MNTHQSNGGVKGELRTTFADVMSNSTLGASDTRSTLFRMESPPSSSCVTDTLVPWPARVCGTVIVTLMVDGEMPTTAVTEPDRVVTTRAPTVHVKRRVPLANPVN